MILVSGLGKPRSLERLWQVGNEGIGRGVPLEVRQSATPTGFPSGQIGGAPKVALGRLVIC